MTCQHSSQSLQNLRSHKLLPRIHRLRVGQCQTHSFSSTRLQGACPMQQAEASRLCPCEQRTKEPESQASHLHCLRSQWYSGKADNCLSPRAVYDPVLLLWAVQNHFFPSRFWIEALWYLDPGWPSVLAFASSLLHRGQRPEGLDPSSTAILSLLLSLIQQTYVIFFYKSPRLFFFPTQKISKHESLQRGLYI